MLSVVHPTMLKPVRTAVVVVALLLHATVSADEQDQWESARGLYRVSFASSIDPIEINRIHEWVVHVETADGEPVEQATLDVAGGMPEHDHGLPTSPRVTVELGNGVYRVQGLRFHMAGDWLIEIEINDGVRTDSVAITLTLQ